MKRSRVVCMFLLAMGVLAIAVPALRAGGVGDYVKEVVTPEDEIAKHNGYTMEFDNGMKLLLGGDMRIRLSSWDRNVISPDRQGPGFLFDGGPDWQYIRYRTRVWGKLDIMDGVRLNARLVNRWHKVSSSPYSDNDRDAATWEFPDEVIVDQLNLELSNIADSNWSAIIGRQDVILGRGMVFLEGTPYDQGRTIYFDGLTLRYKDENDTLTLFGYYNEYKDDFVFINDRNRRLRQGDIFTTGAYWTHTVNKCFGTDAYYVFTDIDDEFPNSGERNWYKDENASIHTVGGRVFGMMTENTDYSIELAREFGRVKEHDSAKLEGYMLDARLNIAVPMESLNNPSVMLEYTWFRGDHEGSDEFEGWYPVFAGYPIWREELMPIMNNGNWTNLHQFRVETKVPVTPKLRFTGAYAYLLADESDISMAAGGGNGSNHMGHLLSGFLDYTYNRHLTFKLEAAQFLPGGYWDEGHSSHWLRFETVYTF